MTDKYNITCHIIDCYDSEEVAVERAEFEVYEGMYGALWWKVEIDGFTKVVKLNRHVFEMYGYEYGSFDKLPDLITRILAEKLGYVSCECGSIEYEKIA